MTKFSIILMLFFPLVLFGQDEFIELWPGDVPSQNEPKAEPKIEIDDIIRYTQVTNPKMEIFRPEKTVDNGNAILVCPGGGYAILAYDLEGTVVAEWFADMGFTAYVLQYRVPLNRKGAFQDVQRAMRIIKSKHRRNSKIGVIGFSAGGNLAAQLSIRFLESSYPRIYSEDYLGSKPDFSILIYPAYLDEGKNETLSPELNLSKELAPFFIFGSGDDRHMTGALVLANALVHNYNKVDLIMPSKGGHGYSMRKGNEAAELWPKLLKDWLDKNEFN